MIRIAPLGPTLALCLVALATACGGGAGDGRQPGTFGDGPRATAVRSYAVRGEITALPLADDPSTDLMIHHEAIDDFTDIDGDVVGMNAMTMPFPFAPEVSLAGLAVGDKVAFTLEVEWEGDPPYRITRIDKLPPDTVLEFRAAR